MCSYGLMQQEIDLLKDVEWQTVVLDEAQAIKNAATKRAQAAMKLRGRFKMVTTGTPLENRLEELHSLFQFINPGLLGSRAGFRERFVLPIEKHKDGDARRRLRKLIRPFILRRTKRRCWKSFHRERRSRSRWNFLPGRPPFTRRCDAMR